MIRSSPSGADDAQPALRFETTALPVLAVRSGLAGLLMGLANLVPGISGGTLLLASGVYPAFIAAIAEITTLRLRLRPILLLSAIAVSAGLAIFLFAGVVRDLVVQQRWVMYSLFIGLTLGGVPLVWRLARPASPALLAGAAGGFALMLLMQLAQAGGGAARTGSLLLVLSGLAGAAAMILPGVSGGYLLLLLGQYERILGAIDQLKSGLLGSGAAAPDMDLVVQSLSVVIPVGIGVVLGIVGVSNLLKWLLERFARPTLGALLGLLLGAVVGLWPFQEPVPPRAGDLIEGHVLDAREVTEIPVENWRVEHFEPRAGQLAGSLGLVLIGLGTTLLIARLGDDAPDPKQPRDGEAGD